MLRFCDCGDQRNHLVDVRFGDHSRRVLRIDQDDVRAGGLEASEALVQKRGVRRYCFVPQHRVRARLPQHQIGLLGDHRGVETREHIGSFLAVDAAVQHRDLVSREMTGEFLRQPARIGGSGRARTRAEGRRGAERHDLDGLTAGKQPGHADQRHIKAHLLSSYDACGRSRRRGCQRGRRRNQPRRLRPGRKQRNYTCRRSDCEDGRATQKEMAMHDMSFVPAGSFFAVLTPVY